MTIVKWRLNLPNSLWEILQVESIASTEQIPIGEHLKKVDTSIDHADSCKQLEINYHNWTAVTFSHFLDAEWSENMAG